MASSYYHGEQLTRDLLKLSLWLIKQGYHSCKAIHDQIEVRYGAVEVKRVRARVDYALQSGLIKQRDGVRGRYDLTADGDNRLGHLLDTTLDPIDTEKEWDGVWHIIMFDVPEKDRALRDAVRGLIKRLGMKELQKSVWVHQYDCSKQFEKLRVAYGNKGHILYISTENISGSNTLTEFAHGREQIR